MADPIMDLLDDTPLFSMDALPESFSQAGADPVEEALKLALGQGPQGQAQVLQGVAGAGGAAGSPSGKLTIARVLTGTPLRPGMSIVSGGTVLNAAQAQAQAQGQGGAGVQRLVQSPNGPLKQVLLTSMPQTQTQQVQLQTPAQTQIQLQQQTPAAAVRPQGVTLTTVPQQGEAKRITLVLQQPAPAGAGQGGAVAVGGAGAGAGQQPRLVLGALPGKLVLQGGQLAALTQARAGQGQGQPGAQPKVLTIQLQVQQQPNAQGAKFQLVSGAPSSGSPQAGSSSSAGGAVSVVKVINTSAAGSSTVTTASVAGQGVAPRSPRSQEPLRRVETLCKQEKANRIVAEAIARAKARGERNIPRVLNLDELPASAANAGLATAELGGAATPGGKKKSSGGGAKKKSPSGGKGGAAGAEKKGKAKAGGGASGGGATAVGGAGVVAGAGGSKSKSKKRRSNRQVKRKKYTEDLDIKITDDEDEQEEEVDENPSEEDAAIVDKVLSMRITKKEVTPGQYVNVEEFFVKYKNYSYMHCEWATLEQLERDKRIHQKLKRFKTKKAQMRHLFQEEEEPFNPDYVEVDRILDESHSVDKDNGEPVVYFLVKWCSLPYEDATWELREDVDDVKVEEFRKIQGRQPRLKRTPRPPASAWKKLEESREYKNGNTLREYQLEGLNWLLFNWYNRQNCILADEMGLGKTIQSISLLSEVFSAGVQGPFLVIAPLSTITNWEREFAGWTHMNAIMVLSDCPELREIAWRCVIIDEAHRLKNRNCKLLDSLKMLDLEHKVLLTGTPLQNTVEELFSLLHFLEPTHLGANQNSNVPNLLNTMMELRKCCNHPYLITGAEEKIVAELREVYDPLAPDFHLQALVRSAGKLVLLDKLLPRLKAGGHKVLIFSQMVRCLDILEDYLIHKRYLYERIDGRVRGNLRQAAIDRFSKPDSDRFVFLLCTRAGGLGINLTAADTCVIFDSDWNPQNDLQAQARCHRIGQSKAVKVYRLITRNSYEREMLDKASLKLGLDRAVLQSMSGNKDSSVNGIQQFSKKEIEDLLRKGAYAAIMDEGDEGSRFCEEDIDQILQRRATTITIESEGKGSTFSKASFVASENRTDIALDDPEFWQKWAKKADIDFDTINRKNTLVIDTPRVRKQTRQFSTLRGEGGAELSDLDSDDEYPPHNSRHARSSRRSDRHCGGGYGRTDCFRVEKHLLVYGWGRWRDILSHARCKRRLGERDVETICRGKRVKAQSSFDVQKVEWIRKYNPDSLLLDDGYRKHLKHQCNKVLLRVRMLYYLRQEVIGDHADRVLRGVDARDVDIWMPEMELQEVPSRWWDTEADRSLLIGVFKHGYEMYTTMRADPCLCFLERVGRPDDQAIDAEQHSADTELGDGGDFDKYSEDPEFKPVRRQVRDPYDEGDSMALDEEICVVDRAGEEGLSSGQAGACDWPTGSSLTARLRRLITAYQRSYRREQLKMEAAEKGDRRRRRCEQASKLKEIARQERQQRWTRREECDFYRVVSTFGVERVKSEEGAEPALGAGPQAGADLDWSRFRSFARLDKKTDESLSRYFHSFMAMCRRVCHLRPAPGEDPSVLSQSLAPITEERASRTLYRIGLLRRLRERVLPHPALEERLLLAPPSADLPAWWRSPQHDRELLQGAARHGVSRTELSIFPDPDFSFRQARQDFLQVAPASRSSTPAPPMGEGPRVKQEEEEKEVAVEGAESRLLGEGSGAAGAPAEAESPAAKPRGRAGWGWKKSRGRGGGGRGRGRRDGEGGQSDSESESDSDSSTSSRRSGSSEESGDSDGEGRRVRVDPLKLCDVDEENSVLSLTPSQDGAPPDSASDPLRADWPKDRVLINRLDSICTVVLTGRWPAGRRQNPEPQPTPPPTDEPEYTRLIHKNSGGSTGAPCEESAEAQDTEFTVKLLKEEGLKLTFSKQALLPNGSGGEGGSRRKRRDLQLSDPDGQGPLQAGERVPRRRDLPDWLKDEGDGDMLELLANSRGQRKRRRRKRSEKVKEAMVLTGSERIKIMDMQTGRKIGGAVGPMLQDLKDCLEENPQYFVAPDLFHRLLPPDHTGSKKGRPCPPPAQDQLEDPLLGAGAGETLVSDGAYMMEDEDLDDAGGMTSSHHFLSPAFDVKMEGGTLQMDAGDGLSQGGYESSDREAALLDDVIMAPKNTDSSSSSED
ncbi:hypothetical protein JZ751_020417 [Albula glossodonta]|uniref:DNA helicase n=1 Tax=Albula glossodonta TaxID=121402 RepID=A0A8T2MSH3_9TELE|nr:hypothetical protein JZ751_020417 [Albula glossodonta]